jgi:hypothetical protein
MLSDEQRSYLIPVIRRLQIIVVAMVGGVVMFFAVALIVAVDPQGGGAAVKPFQSYVAAGFGAAAIVLSVVAPPWFARRTRQAIDEGKVSYVTLRLRNDDERIRPANEFLLGGVGPMMAEYQTRLIIRAAILEGAAFYNLTAYMLEKQSLNLVAAGILLLFLLVQFPTCSRAEEWVEGELSAAAQMRQIEPNHGR